MKFLKLPKLQVFLLCLLALTVVLTISMVGSKTTKIKKATIGRIKITSEKEAIAEAKTLVEERGKDEWSRGQKILNWEAPIVTHKTVEVTYGEGVPSRWISYWIVSFLVYTEPGHIPPNDFTVWLPDDPSEKPSISQAID